MRIVLMRCALVAFGALFLASCRSDSPRAAKPHPPAPVAVASPGDRHPRRAIKPFIVPFSDKAITPVPRPDSEVRYFRVPALSYNAQTRRWEPVPYPNEELSPSPRQTPRARFMLLPNATPYNERR